MAFHIKSIAQAKQMAVAAKTKVEGIRKTYAYGIGETVRVGEIGGAAFGFGWVNGRFGEAGELAVAGIPVDLTVGIALHTAAFLGGFGKGTSGRSHGHNLGTAGIASAAYRFGSQVGLANKPHQAALPQAQAQAALPPWLSPPWALPSQYPQQAPQAAPQPQATPQQQPQAAPQPGVPHP